jgi:hypothetical protein
MFKKPTIYPIYKVGSCRNGSLKATYDEIVERLGPPNVTHLDDPYKVKASWGFKDYLGIESFIWCYKVDDPTTCTNWSTGGSVSLINDIFERN